MWRKIESKMWADSDFRKLSSDAKYVFSYLITNPHTHVSGLYYLPENLGFYETGLSSLRFRRAIGVLVSNGMVFCDERRDLIFVKNMLRYQGDNQKCHISASKQCLDFKDSPLIEKLLEANPQVQPYFSGNAPIGYPKRVSQEQKQETETEQESEQEQEQDTEQEQEQPIEKPVPLGRGLVPDPFPSTSVDTSKLFDDKKDSQLILLADGRVKLFMKLVPRYPNLNRGWLWAILYHAGNESKVHKKLGYVVRCLKNPEWVPADRDVNAAEQEMQDMAAKYIELERMLR